MDLNTILSFIGIVVSSAGLGFTLYQFFEWRVGYTGQLLTDFSNGVAFKQQLQAKEYEGYLFMEEKDYPTICIFESGKLNAPTHLIV